MLAKLFGSIIIPEAVANECLSEMSRPGAIAIQKAINDKVISIHAVPTLAQSDSMLDILGAGEAAAIKLAHSLNLPLITDERLGRSTAKKLKIKIIGTAGILLLAKERKIIDAVNPVLIQLKQAGYYLADDLVRDVLVRAGEIKV